MVGVRWLVVAAAHAATAAVGPGRIRDALSGTTVDHDGLTARDSSDTNANNTKPLRCLQVTSPMLTPDGMFVDDDIVDPRPFGYSPKSHTQILMEHSFGFSYGLPFVAEYKPPKLDFNRVILNLTVVSQGRQFDRLATMSLGDVEVWRTSTAEPKAAPGIVWTSWKDMTHYLSLWKEPQKLIFDLGNLIDDKYTGRYKDTLTAIFVREKGIELPPPGPADLIVPFSGRRSASNFSSTFTYPDSKAESQITLPQNIHRAVVSIAANGQLDEEFWWSNVPDEGTHTFPNATLPGLSSFREIRLRIDGHLVGLSWPMPVIFTGGISPPLHRPIVGLQAFDIREQEIDITPWAGLICDGKPHNFSMEVVGQNEQVVPRYWVLSAKIFVWYGAKRTVTEGSTPHVCLTKLNYVPVVEVKENEYLRYNQTVSRKLIVKSKIRRNGYEKSYDVKWTQEFSMGNAGLVARQGDGQMVWALYRGEDKAEEDRWNYYQSTWKYPVQVSYLAGSDPVNTLTLDANLTQGEQRNVSGEAVFPTGIESWRWKLKGRAKLGIVSTTTQRSGRGFFYQRNGGKESGGFGDMVQTYELGGQWFRGDEPTSDPDDPVLYRREIWVANETTTYDKQSVWMAPAEYPVSVAEAKEAVPGSGFEFAPALAKGMGGGSNHFYKGTLGRP